MLLKGGLFVRRLRHGNLQEHPVVSPQSMHTWHEPFCFTFMLPQAEHCAPVKPSPFASFARAS